MAMVIGLSGFSSMSAADSSLQTAGLMQAMASQQTAEAVELPAKLASAAYSAASDSVILKENTDPLKIHDQMTGETYNGQWLEFQVSVPEDGKYAFTARVQSPAGERPRMDVLVDMVHALTVEEGDRRRRRASVDDNNAAGVVPDAGRTYHPHCIQQRF